MAISVTQLHPVFVGEVSGVDLRQPLDKATVGALNDAINKHGVLVFHGQMIDDAQQQAFSRMTERAGSRAVHKHVGHVGHVTSPSAVPPASSRQNRR